MDAATPLERVCETCRSPCLGECFVKLSLFESACKNLLPLGVTVKLTLFESACKPYSP